MKRILFFLSALMLTSISYAQTMDKQMKKATKSANATIATGQTQTGKYTVTGSFQAPKKVKKQLPENALLLKPYPNRTRTLLDNFLESPAARSLNLGKITPKGKRNMPGMFRFGETTYSIPFTADFTSEDAFMVIDNNEDATTWFFSTNGFWRYNWSSANAADDYLISSPLSLEAGKNYEITVNAQTGGYDERFEVLVGKEATVDGLTSKAFGPIETSTYSAEDFSGSFTPTETGTYYVAIHCISDADMFYLRINGLSVTAGASTNAPAAPTVTATPGENGALTATVEVTAPKNAINGEKLSDNLTKVELYRDGELVYTKEDVAPGGKFTYTDEGLTNGNHKYYAIASNTEGTGQKSEEVSVYVGVDVPATPENLESEDQFSSILFTWDKVGEVGKNNGYVNPSDVMYTLWSLEYYSGFGYYLDQELDSVKDASSLTYEINTLEGEQDYGYYAVTAKNAAGRSSGYITSILLGAPYDLPLTEGFANNSLHYLWDTDGDLLVSTASTDGDGTALLFTAEEEGYAYFLSGKLNLKGAANPTLVMDVAGNVGQIYIVGIADNGEMVSLGSVTVDEESIGTIKVPLSSIVGEHFSQVGILAPIETPTDDTINDYVLIDNIRIYDMLSDDLAVTVKAPSSVKAGKSATITAIVENKGDNDATAYNLSIKAGDKVLLNESVGGLVSTAKEEFTVELETSIFDEAADIPIVAEVTYSADVNTENNKAETQISILASSLPAPENLVAEVNGENGVDLSWNAPASEAGQVTEDFEDTSIFPAFDLGGITAENHNGAFGDWTLYDGTGKEVYTWSSSSVSYENAEEPSAWQVFDPVKAGLSSEAFGPSSGSQFLMSMCVSEYDEDDNIYPTDHWLISPKLTGAAQTISFQARALTSQYGAETFEILVSNTDNAPESFVKVNDYSIEATEWTEFNAELPEGTKYFAIRHTSTDVFALFLDDITYEKAASKPTAYNIYFEDELVGTVDGTVTTFTIGADQTLTGEHNVGVTAVYDTQESAPAQATVNIGGAFQLGDVNHDGQVNITDVTLTVNFVLTGSTTNFFINEANVNQDSEVNITDVTALVNLVLAAQH